MIRRPPGEPFLISDLHIDKAGYTVTIESSFLNLFAYTESRDVLRLQKGSVVTDKQSQWNNQIIAEFRANNGDINTNGFGKSLILVHHTGARTGTRRINPLRSVHDGNGTWWVVASKQGSPENPDWYHNLKTNPLAEIETPDNGSFPVVAEVLAGKERDHAWQQFTAENPIFLQYQKETTRTFPVLALHKRQ